MAFEVSIKITAESQLEAVKAAETAIRSVGAAAEQAGTESAALPQSLSRTTEAAEKLTLRGLGLRRSLGLVAGNLGAIGPSGSLAANALLVAAAGGGVLGVSLAATSAVIGFFITRAREAAEETKRFKEAVATGDLGFFESQVRSATDRVEELLAAEEKVARLGTGFLSHFTPQPDTLSSDKLAAIADQVFNQANRQKILQDKANETFSQTTEKLRLQTQAIGATAQEAARLEEQLVRLEAGQRGLGNASKEERDAFENQIIVYRNAKIAQANLEEGRKALSQGIQALGVDLRLTQKETDALARQAFRLERQFQTGKISEEQYSQGLKGIAQSALEAKEGLKEVSKSVGTLTGPDGQLHELFETEKKQGPQSQLLGFIDQINALAKRPIGQIFAGEIEAIDRGVKEFEKNLRTQVGFEIPSAVQKMLQQVKGGLDRLKAEANLDIKADGSQAEGEIERLKAELDELQRKAGQPLGVGGGGGGFAGPVIPFSGGQVSNPFSAFSQAHINQINQAAQGVQPITIPVFTSGSPTLPFSDYFETYAPEVIAEFGRKISSGLTPTIDLGQFMSDLNSISELAQQNKPSTLFTYFTQAHGRVNVHPSVFQGADREQKAIRNATEFIMAQALARGILIPPGTNVFDPIALRKAARPIPGAAGGGFEGGGGFSGGVNVTIDLRGAHISQELLDRKLIPQFEGVLRKTTGQDVSFGVMS